MRITYGHRIQYAGRAGSQRNRPDIIRRRLAARTRGPGRMTAPALPVAARNRARPLLALATVALAITSLGAGVFSLAYFTSSTAVGANSFTTGTIVIGASPSTALFTVANMMPGDSNTQALTIQNNGTAQLRYAMSTAATNTDSKGLR